MNYVIYNMSCWLVWKPTKLWTRLLPRFCYHWKFLYFWNNFDENWFYENGWNYVQQTATCFWGVFRWNTTWRISHYQQVRLHKMDYRLHIPTTPPTQFLKIFFRIAWVEQRWPMAWTYLLIMWNSPGCVSSKYAPKASGCLLYIISAIFIKSIFIEIVSKI